MPDPDVNLVFEAFMLFPHGKISRTRCMVTTTPPITRRLILWNRLMASMTSASRRCLGPGSQDTRSAGCALAQFSGGALYVVLQPHPVHEAQLLLDEIDVFFFAFLDGHQEF